MRRAALIKRPLSGRRIGRPLIFAALSYPRPYPRTPGYYQRRECLTVTHKTHRNAHISGAMQRDKSTDKIRRLRSGVRCLPVSAVCHPHRQPFPRSYRSDARSPRKSRNAGSDSCIRTATSTARSPCRRNQRSRGQILTRSSGSPSRPPLRSFLLCCRHDKAFGHAIRQLFSIVLCSACAAHFVDF
jgi:hypothetical protein